MILFTKQHITAHTSKLHTIYKKNRS